MRRITIAEIDVVVAKLLAPIIKKNSDLEEEIRNAVAFHLHEEYPEEIHTLKAKGCKFLNYQTYICAYYLGQHKGISFSTPGIVAKGRDLNITDRTVAAQIQKCVNEITDLKKKYAIMDADITDTLKRLRTFEHIRKEFPEAAAFLPEDAGSNLPALNISDIQNKLKELP